MTTTQWLPGVADPAAQPPLTPQVSLEIAPVSPCLPLQPHGLAPHRCSSEPERRQQLGEDAEPPGSGGVKHRTTHQGLKNKWKEKDTELRENQREPGSKAGQEAVGAARPAPGGPRACGGGAHWQRPARRPRVPGKFLEMDQRRFREHARRRLRTAPSPPSLPPPALPAHPAPGGLRSPPSPGHGSMDAALLDTAIYTFAFFFFFPSSPRG